jgi:hypothetical protein
MYYLKSFVLIIFILPVTATAASGQQLNMPPTQSPQRGVTDLQSAITEATVKHPTLALSGFQSGHAKGNSLEDVLQQYINNNRDLSRVKNWATNPMPTQRDSEANINQAARTMEARAFLALAVYVLTENGYGNNFPFQYAIPIRAASNLHQAMLATENGYRGIWEPSEQYHKDMVKITSTPMQNIARTADLYLALENAVCYYEGQCSGNSDLLLSGEEKLTFFDRYGAVINIAKNAAPREWVVNEYIPDPLQPLVDQFFPDLDRTDVEHGNAPLKLETAVGYMSLPAQQVIPGRDSELKTAIGGYYKTGNRANQWWHQTGGGQRFWGEGPYYFEYALDDAIPFWHALRANSLLNFGAADGRDPFNALEFTRPISWLADLVTPDGRNQPVEDGHKHRFDIANTMSWTGSYGDATQGKKFEWIEQKGEQMGNPVENASWSVFTMAVPKTTTALPPKNNVPASTSSSEQQIVVRNAESNDACNDFDSGDGCNQLYLNGEKGKAYTAGEGHEHPDQLNLLWYVDDLSVLIDPGYISSGREYSDHNVMAHPFTQENTDAVGLEGPTLSLSAEALTIDPKDRQNLGRKTFGEIDILHGKQGLPETFLFGPEGYCCQGANSRRDVLYIPGGSGVESYVVDFLRGKWPDKSNIDVYHDAAKDPRNYLRAVYNVRAQSTQINGFADYDNPNHFITFPEVNGSNKDLRMYPLGAEQGFNDDGEVPGGEIMVSTINTKETFGSTESAQQLEIVSNLWYQHSFSLVNLMYLSSQTPSHAPENLLTNSDDATGWVWKRGTETYDVFVGREVNTNSAPLRSSIEAKSGYPDFRVELPSGKRYGFARIHKSNGEWQVDPNYQVNLERAPMEASISGPTSLESGQQGTWTADVTGGSGSTSYDWEYRPLGSSSWQDKFCTGESCSHTFYNNSEQVQNGGIRTVVTKGTETDTAQTYVFVSPSCGDNVLICPATASSAVPADSSTTSKPKYLALRSLQVEADGPASTLTWTTTGPVPPSQFVVQSRPDSTAQWSDLETVRAADSVRTDSTDKPAYQLTTEPPSAGNASAFQIRLSYQHSDAPDRFSEILSPTEGIASLSDTAPSSLASNAPAPVHSLRAESASGGIDLTWKTELPPSRSFVVQHRADSSASWSTLGTVAAGDSTSAGSPQAVAYRFQTHKLGIGTHQFRVGWPRDAGPASRAAGNSETSASRRYTEPVTATIEMEEAYRLSTYPNPVRKRATVELAVEERQNVQVRLYDVLGRRVATLHSGPLPAQELRRLQLDVSSTGLTSGTYFLRATGEDFAATEQMTVVR